MSAAELMAAAEAREATIRACMAAEHEHPACVMSVLELLLDIAYHDGGYGSRQLAVAAEAWTLAGYHDGSIMVSHASQYEVYMAVGAARARRHRRLLKAEARGLLAAVQQLVAAGAVTGAVAREAARIRWVDRGGHGR